MNLNKLKYFLRKSFGDIKAWTIIMLRYLGFSFIICIILLCVTQPFKTELQLSEVIPETNIHQKIIFFFTALPVGVGFEEIIRYAILMFFQFVSKKIERRWANALFLIVATLWSGYIHQALNIATSDLLGVITYTSIHLVLGLYFAWLLLKKGFALTFTVHYLYDFMLMCLTIW